MLPAPGNGRGLDAGARRGLRPWPPPAGEAETTKISSATVHLTVQSTPPAPAAGRTTIALVGNPNAGKTTLFNALTGLRAKTANFPGTTIEHRFGRLPLNGTHADLIDLPGLYSLSAATREERIARDVLMGEAPGLRPPAAVLLILDATNLQRNLFLASQVLELGRPTVVALNMMDLARRAGVHIDTAGLSRELGCPVVPVAARSGQGVDSLREELARSLTAARPRPTSAGCLVGCTGCPYKARYDWVESVGRQVLGPAHLATGRRTAAIDRVLTHPVVGVAAFLAVMVSVFAVIFWLAQYPMALIDGLFASVGGHAGQALGAVADWAPAGWFRDLLAVDLRSLVVEGVIGGVGGVLIFLPQICLLFFLLSLLEDTGYLARAAFVMDRLMRRVGLPGKAFVPMLSAHACAVPAVMSARVIEDPRDRLVTILVLPLLTCSARIPVYVMLVALLFPGAPLKAAAVFTGAYLLGILAALGMALVLKRSILRGETKPLVLELPGYKLPSLRNAAMAMCDRAMVFVKQAGTVILLVSVILWALAHYPKSAPPAAYDQMVAQAAALQARGQPGAEALEADAERLRASHELAHSAAGRLGRWIEPALKPMGFDWQIGIGILSSFAAREVFVSTLAIVYGVGADAADDNPQGLYAVIRGAQRSDGTPVFTPATCTSLLVFYVLAMQCMSTSAVVRRETGKWRWAIFQFVYMSVLAVGGAIVSYQALLAWGVR